ncbi:unnamed protein product [Owenia fusiformis]|uniref:G-protein coupled receptors family 1 profile domain-containing protein n=1 Tax=Owenia fusiformis TaxID=6347 RepID=A0A8S4NPH6_OWEFU|nr:unnamed protein product [Owenia fusiformis]
MSIILNVPNTHGRPLWRNKSSMEEGSLDFARKALDNYSNSPWLENISLNENLTAIDPRNGENSNSTTPVYFTTRNVIVGGLLSCILLLTLFGNILVITAIAKFRRLRTVTNYFVCSLAVADITVALLVMPHSIIKEIYGQWSFGWIFCYFWISCDVMCCTASILHLCVISLDRYFAITDPLKYSVRMSRKRACVFITIVWVCSVTISFMPIFLGWFSDHSVNLYTDNPVCMLNVNRVYAVISSMTSFYVPLIIMIFAYITIFRIAMRQAREIRKLENSFSSQKSMYDSTGTSFYEAKKHKKRSRKIRRDSKAIKTLGILMGLFCFCWLPFFLMYIIMPFCPSCYLPPAAESFITWLGYVNSCFNPCVYAFLQRDYRLAYKKLLRFCVCQCCKTVCSKYGPHKLKPTKGYKTCTTNGCVNGHRRGSAMPSGLLEYVLDSNRASVVSAMYTQKDEVVNFLENSTSTNSGTSEDAKKHMIVRLKT